MKDGVDCRTCLTHQANRSAPEQIYARDNADSSRQSLWQRHWAIGPGACKTHAKTGRMSLEAVTADGHHAGRQRMCFNREAAVTGWLMREEVTEWTTVFYFCSV